MKKDDLLKLNLQLFAEGNTDEVDNPAEPEAEQEKTVSLAEMQRRLAKAEEKHQAELEQLKQSQAESLQQAMDEYRAENELKGEELHKFKEQKAEAEKQELLDKIAQLELEKTRTELKDEAIKTLTDRKLPVTDDVLSFVVKDTAEDTLSAIDAMQGIINDVKAQYASGSPLQGGSHSTEKQRTVQDILSSAKVTSF